MDHNSVYRVNLRKKNQRSHPLYFLGRNVLRMARPVLSALSRKCFKSGEPRYLCIVTDQSQENQMRRTTSVWSNAAWESGDMDKNRPYRTTWCVPYQHREDRVHVSGFTQLRELGSMFMSAHGRSYGDLWLHVAAVTVACSTSCWLAPPFGWFRLSQWVDDNNTSHFASSTLSMEIPN